MCIPMLLKQFLHLSTCSSLPQVYPHFFDNKQLNPPSSFNILGFTFSPNLSWKDHISSLDKTAPMKLGVLCRYCDFFTPMQLLPLYRGGLTTTTLLVRMESKTFRLISSTLLTYSLQPRSLHRKVPSFLFRLLRTP